jgi:hypothetical protein
LFVYNRPAHTRLTIEALARNTLAADSDLLVLSDGPRLPAHTAAVDSVRAYLRSVTGFKSVQLTCQDRNLGLAGSIIRGVTQICQAYGRVIVVEDDLVTSPHFLTYMNEALELYASEDAVVSIHGYVYPVDRPLPETFFLRGADCWGWATWQRGWQVFNPDGAALLAELQRRKLTREFDYNGASRHTKMLQLQIEKKNDSWAIRWHASAFLANKLTLYPGRSLVCNIGFMEGTHFLAYDFPDVILSGQPVQVERLACRQNEECRAVFARFFRQRRRFTLKKLFARITAQARALWPGLRAVPRSKGA